MPEESPTRFIMVPARRSNEPTARRRARRILGALFLASTLSLIAIVFALARGQGATDFSAVNPQGRDLAYAAAVNYLTGGYQSVPHATSFNPDDLPKALAGLSFGGQQPAPMAYQSVSWVGFSPEHFVAGKGGYENFEIHHFLVVLGTSSGPTASPQPPAGSQPPASPQPTTTRKPRTKPSAVPSGGPSDSPFPGVSQPVDSQSPAPSQTPGSPTPSPTGSGTSSTAPNADQVQLDVPILLTPQGPRLAASPTFSVWTGAAGATVGKGDYTDFSTLLTQVNDPVKNQIMTWAKAYVSGDANGLLTVTGDQNKSHRYAGLSGFTLPDTSGAVQILSAITVDHGQLVVRARVLLARAVPPGTVSGGNGNAPQFETFADFDLLVGAPGGAQPPILAWGPAGSAAQLEPYSNALSS